MKRQLFGVKLNTVKVLYVVPFLCVFTNIIILKPSFQEICVVGYEYVKLRKEWWSIYKDGDLLWRLEYCFERYVKQYNSQNMRNFWPQYIKQFVLSCSFISLLYSPIYFHSLLFYYVAPVRSKCSESPIEAAWYRSAENTIISGSMIDISTGISYLKRILHNFVSLSTRVISRLSAVSFLSSCAVWGTVRVTLDVRLDVDV